MRGFCEWPGIVTEIENGLITVNFFGDCTFHKATICNFYKFEESSDIILANLRKRKTPLYMKSVREAEAVLGIPLPNSITYKI